MVGGGGVCVLGGGGGGWEIGPKKEVGIFLIFCISHGSIKSYNDFNFFYFRKNLVLRFSGQNEISPSCRSI